MRKTYAPCPHFYLQAIGIQPGAQGKGLASHLIRPFLVEADVLWPRRLYRNDDASQVALYEHFGFRIVETYNAPGTPLTLWGFYRAAG